MLLVLALVTHAEAYSIKDIDLTKYEFNRYVRPQLISIYQDYQSLILQINPELGGIKPLFNIFRNLKKTSIKIDKSCKGETNLACQEGLSEYLENLRASIKVANVKISYKDKEHFTPDDLIEALAAQTRLNKELNDLYIRMENIYFLYIASTNKDLSLQELINDTEQAYNLFHDFIIKASDNRFRSEFISFWGDFIKPVSRKILPLNDTALFIQKINDFNLRLNFLNVVLTKRNKPINKSSKTLVKMIHNQWNNILKVSLKRYR